MFRRAWSALTATGKVVVGSLAVAIAFAVLLVLYGVAVP